MMGSGRSVLLRRRGSAALKKDLGLLDLGQVGNPSYQWGPASSPVIAGDRVIVQNDQQQGSFLVAYDSATGKQLWRTRRDEFPSWSTPLVVRQGDRTLVVTTSPAAVRASDAATGKEVWHMDDDAQVRVPSPVPFGDLVIVTGGHPPGGNPISAIPLASTKPVSREKLAWRIDRGSPSPPPLSCTTASSTSLLTTACCRPTMRPRAPGLPGPARDRPQRIQLVARRRRRPPVHHQ